MSGRTPSGRNKRGSMSRRTTSRNRVRGRPKAPKAKGNKTSQKNCFDV